MSSMQFSYSHGITSVPLLGDTIGENLRRTVERFGDREALVSLHQNYRATYRQLWEETGVIGRGLLARGVQKGDRVALWSPNRYEWVVTQYATARIGAIMVNINPAYRSHELEHVLTQSGCSLLIMARQFRHTDYVSMFQEVEERLPAHIQALVIDDEWGALREDARRVSEEELFRRPDQHPVHQRHHRQPQGRHAVAPQHPQQRLLRRRGDAATRPRATALHPGAALPLLRHGDGQPRLPTHGATMVFPARVRSGWRRCRRRRGALHRAARRADDVHRRARPSATSPSFDLSSCAPASWPARPARSR
jgi:hypothetical protein